MGQNRKILLTTITGHALVHSITLVYPAIMIVLRNQFNVSLVELGELGTIQFLFFGLGAFPAGWLVDRIGSRRVLIIYFWGLAASAFIITLAKSFLILAVGLGSLGLFAGLYHPAGLNLISHTRKLSQNMGYHGISGSIGLAAGPLIGGGIAGFTDWRLAYILLALVAAAGALFTLTQVQSESIESHSDTHPRLTLTSAHWVVFIVSALWGFAHHGLFNYLPLYFTEAVSWDGLADSAKGGLLTALVLVLGVIGQMVGGRLGESIPRRRLLAWVVGLNIPFLILMGYTQDMTLIIIVGILGAINFTYQPVNNSLIADITPASSRGMIYGISSGLGFGVGSFAATAGGYIGQYYTLSQIFPVLSIVLIPAVLLSLTLVRDRK